MILLLVVVLVPVVVGLTTVVVLVGVAHPLPMLAALVINIYLWRGLYRLVRKPVSGPAARPSTPRTG
ncbi:hypothetical protein BH24ACT3_BH24ACT3_04030 [soil metagenome]